jgi:DNA-binding SARP family transcriptional activator/tetratricopeptide (TPR) repeat protein
VTGKPWFGILGPLAAGGDAGQRLELGGRKQRDLLAMLLINLDRCISASRIADALWHGEPPAGADVTLRTHVSHLRRRLATIGAQDALVTRQAGYGLFLHPDQLDAAQFEQLVGLGQEALGLGEPERGAHLFANALSLWRGSVLEDLGPPEFASTEAARLEELRLVALDHRIDADLSLGKHRALVAELQRLVVAHPFRERLHCQLMLALYRSGRQADALAVSSSVRRQLAEELGVDPGPALRDLEAAILRHDATLLPPDERLAELGLVAPQSPGPDALFEAARRAPIVGRGEELDRLDRLCREVREGGRHVVVISGEAGIGKTRLVAELADRASADGAVILVGRCDPLAVAPYQPVAAALSGTLAAAPEAIRARLASLLSAVPAPTADEPGELLAVFDTFVGLLRGIAAAAPVVLALEDCERLDHASSRLLRYLFGRLPERVLVVVCYRDPPGTRHEALLDLLGDAGGFVDRLVLRPLPEDDVAALVPSASQEFVHRIWRKTGGNPYYISEVVRELAGRDSTTIVVPTGLRDMLRKRLRQLPDTTIQIVRAAAVLGGEAEFDILAGLVDLAEDTLIEGLEDAVGAGFLVEVGGSWRGSYAFPHELTRDAVYADIAIPRRQRLHLRVAHALLDRAGTDVAAAAVHMRQAGAAADPMQAAELSLRAAAEARRLYAWDEAIGHAEAAVEILERVGAPAARQGDAATRAAMLRLYSGIGPRHAIEHLEAALRHYHCAGDDAAAGSVHGRLGVALSTDRSVLDIPRAMEHFATAERLHADPVHVYRGRSLAATYGVRTALLESAAQRALDVATDLNRRDLVVLAGWGIAWGRFNRGALADAGAACEEMWAVTQELADPFLAGMVHGPAVCATVYLLDPERGRFWCRRGLAQPRLDAYSWPHRGVVDALVLAMAAMGEMAEARRVAQRLPHNAGSHRVLLLLAGKWEQAAAEWADVLAADDAAGDRHDAAMTARLLARTRLLLGQKEEGVELLDRSLAIGIDGPQIPTELGARAELARLLASADHLARCDEIIAAGEDWCGLAGTVELGRGAVAAHQGDDELCDAAHQRAVEIFTAYHLPWHHAEALDAWARLLAASGRTEDAAAKQQKAWAIYDRIGAAPRWRRLLP